MRRARREAGEVTWTKRGYHAGTRPTMRCVHCGGHRIIPAAAKPEDMGGFCRLCMGTTCTSCAGKGCTPFERKLELAEARDRSLRSMGL
jgi:hypothetical protein